MTGPRLAQLELCQVRPDIGVEIECVVDSGNVGVMKPDPRIFEVAIDLLGLDADQIWHVGDMPAIYVIGARRAVDDIESGRFAAEWDAERDAGYPKLTERKEQHAGPGVRDFEADLRRSLGPAATVR